MKAFKTLKFPLRTVSVFKVISHWSKFSSFHHLQMVCNFISDFFIPNNI